MLAEEESAIANLNDLFGEPPLIKGEDAKRYWRLHAAITHAINASEPETFFDKIRARDFTDKLWQQQRCKQGAASLVEGAYMEALASLLRPFTSPPLISINEDAAAKMARDYFSGESKANVNGVELKLAVYGITEAQIRAKAMQICGGGILMLNRMETNCESSLRMLQKENDRTRADSARARGLDKPNVAVLK